MDMAKTNAVIICWEVLPRNFTQQSPTKTFIRWKTEITTVKLETTHKPATNHSQTSHKSATNQPHPSQTTDNPANYEQKISFLCYQKLQRQHKTCAKFVTILRQYINVYANILTFSSEDQS